MNGSLSTGEIAKVCRCGPRSVAKWIDTGLLRGFRMPSSRARRAVIADLVPFMRHHGMPESWIKELERKENATVQVPSADAGAIHGGDGTGCQGTQQ